MSKWLSLQANLMKMIVVARVKAYMENHGILGEISMYGDHSSDWPFMDYADKAYAVYPTNKMRMHSFENNVEYVER